MKTIKNDKVSAELFDSIYEFRDSLSRPTNSVFEGKKLSSKEEGDSWYGTKTWEKSIELLSSGYKEGVKKILKAGSLKTSVVERSKPKVGVCGFAPHVPNTIMGIPYTMIDRKKIVSHSRTIVINYDRSAYGNVSETSMAEESRKLLNVINALESDGNRVTLNILSTGVCGSENALCSIKVKDSTQPLNLLKISYPLVHTAFERRQGFCWFETSPVVTDSSFSCGYGAPLFSNFNSEEEYKSFLVDSGVIRKDDYIVSYRTLRINTEESLLEMFSK